MIRDVLSWHRIHYGDYRTEGYSGADLENLVREAVLHLLTQVVHSYRYSLYIGR